MNWLSKYSNYINKDALTSAIEEKKKIFDLDINKPFLEALKNLPDIESTNDFSANSVSLNADIDAVTMEKIKLAAKS